MIIVPHDDHFVDRLNVAHMHFNRRVTCTGGLIGLSASRHGPRGRTKYPKSAGRVLSWTKTRAVPGCALRVNFADRVRKSRVNGIAKVFSTIQNEEKRTAGEPLV